jgi:pimeloyl-ACP methyl ester carboxylesterase
VLGWSQGGAAAAALSELDDHWFGDLRLRRCCAMSPGVIAASSAAPGADVAALSDSSLAPSPHLLMTIYGHAEAFEELDIADMLTPLGHEIMDQIWNTQPVHHLGDTTSRMFAFSGNLIHGNPLSDPSWSKAMLEGSAGLSPPKCEVLVCMDGFRNGSVVPIAWQERYVAMVEQFGATVTVKRYDHDDHFSLPGACVDDAINWFIESQATGA